MSAFKYGNDYLVFFDTGWCVDTRVGVLKVLKEKWSVLKYTFEMPKDGRMRFLDLNISFDDIHTCSICAPNSVKQFNSVWVLKDRQERHCSLLFESDT